jgi:hypothetical protein
LTCQTTSVEMLTISTNKRFSDENSVITSSQ